MTGMLAEALKLAASGWAVFPCVERGAEENWKSPYTEHGHLEASTDSRQIRAWWSRWPAAMIGAPVPPPLLVLDLDPRNGGSVGSLPPLPPTLTAWSGRDDGGCHFYFLRPPGAFTSTRLPEGWDLKVNGYCILPPSLHPATGKPYTWAEHEPAPLPDAIRELLRPIPAAVPRFRQPSGSSGRQLAEFVARQPHGNINDALYWAARRAAERGILTDDLAAALVTAAGQAAGGQATAALSAEADDGAADESLSVRLLADLAAVFGDGDKLPTSVLLDRLHGLEESPWNSIGKPPKPLDASGLAYRLKPFSVRPKVLRLGEGTARGYHRADLADAWARYLPRKGGETTRNGVTPQVTDPGLFRRYGSGVTASHDQGPDQDGYGVTPVTPTPACARHQTRFGPHPDCRDCQALAEAGQ